MNFKKIVAVAVAVLVMAPAMMAASPTKQLEKAREKERKSQLTYLKKEGWKPIGTTHSLEVALLSHWAAVDAQPGAREISGSSSRSKSKNIGLQMATNNAIIKYSQECQSTLEGQLISDWGASGVDVSKEFENMFGAFRRNVEKEINGELKHSFSLCRENSDGTWEIESFFIVDEQAASQKRIQALRNAMKESEVAAEHAQKINDFISRNMQ